MATDWAADVKKYVANADDAAIAGIVRYCGIALRNRDSSLVAFSDKTELDRVRNNFLKKKLGLTQSDATLDKAIAKVGEVMKADRTKNRVTVYYLLAAEFKKLGLFVKKAAAEKAKAPAAKAPAAKAPAKKAAAPAKAAGAAAAVAGAAGAAKAATKKTSAPKKAAPAAKADAKPAAKAAAPAKKAAAPAKKATAPAKKAAAAAKKAAPAKKAAAAKPQSLMDKAADTASDAGKAGSAAVAGTVAAVGAVGAAAVAAASGATDTVKDTAAKAVGAAGDAAGAAAGAVSGAAGAAAEKAGALFSGGGQASAADDDGAGLGWLWWLLGIALVIFLLWWLLSRGVNDAAPASSAPTEAAASAAPAEAAVDLAAAPAEGSVAIPAGEGVTSELRDGKPVVKVYFASGKVDVAQAFTPAAGGLKAWLDKNPGSSLAISGYADPSGNAAQNAEFAKQRAQAVQAALVATGVPEASAQLVKPENVTDASVAKDAARRVEVVVK